MADYNIGSPQHWWQILSSGSSAELPFRAYYDELRPIRDVQEAELPSPIDVEILLRARRLEPPPAALRLEESDRSVDTELLEDWSDQIVLAGDWGEDNELVEDWFEAGDSQRCATDLLVEEPEVRWERALRWVRSLYDRSRHSGEPTVAGRTAGVSAICARGGHLSRPQTQE